MHPFVHKQIKMKFNIALQQNCNQSETVQWSKWSSEQNWRIGEWRLIWTQAQIVTESLPKQQETSSSNDWFCWQENHLFCNRAYRITNTVLHWWVYQAGVGWRGTHMTMPHGCHMLHLGTTDWLCSANTKVRMFSTYCTNHGAEFPLHWGVLCTVVKRMCSQALS